MVVVHEVMILKDLRIPAADYSKLIQSTATGFPPVCVTIKSCIPVGALRTLVLISVHFSDGFMGNSAIAMPLSPGVRRVIVPPFSERTRALRRFTGALPKSTLLYATHVSALWNKVCHPSNVLEGFK